MPKQKVKMFLGILSFVVTAHTLPVVAEEEVIITDLLSLSLEELMDVPIVTIATGVEQDLFKAPAIASVITAEDIKAMGASDLDEVLESVPGLHVSNYSLGYVPIYSIRGMYSDNNAEVLLLINGIPYNKLYVGSQGVYRKGMSLKAIKRIEIIRGPGSALYGADAFSGVINIVTKTGKDIDGTEVGAKAGSFDTYEGYILHGGKWGDNEVVVSLEYRTTQGHTEEIEADAQTLFDKIYGTNASFAPGPAELGYKLLDARVDIKRDKWQLRVGYKGRFNYQTGAGNAQALDPNGKYKDERVTADLTYHNPKLTENWDVTAQASFYGTSSKPETNIWFFPPGTYLFGGVYPEGYIGNPSVSERHGRFNLSGFYKGIDNHLIRLGAGYHYGDLYKVGQVSNFGVNPETKEPLQPGGPLFNLTDTPYTFIPERAREDWDIYIQDTWSISNTWELTTGLRYDEYSDFGSTTNPRVALVWQTTPKFSTKLLYGRAFRAPSFYELSAINNPVKLGNPNLKPEMINTGELAFDYRMQEDLHFALNLFVYRWKDKITYMPDEATSTITAQNIGTQDGRGFEFETKWQATEYLNIQGNYAYVNSKDKDHDHDSGNVPSHQIYLRSDWLFAPNWHLNSRLSWIGKRERLYNDPREPLDGYTMADLTLHYKAPQDKWQISVGVRNLFDVDAREPSLGPNSRGLIYLPNDLPLAGRHYFAGIEYRF